VPTTHPLDSIGAELRGLDLGRGLADEDFASLRLALLEHGVLVLRDQSLDDAQQIALGRRFGELEGQEFTGGAAQRDVLVVSNVLPDGRVAPAETGRMRSISINEVWHTDSSFRDVPAAVSIFRAVEVPPVGGDTLYASLRRGWLELDEARRAKLVGLRAIHDYGAAYDRAGGRLPDEARRLMTPVSHPMLRRHPETGETVLYVSGHASGVEGLAPDEGRALIEELVAFCTRKGRVYRHLWQPGDLVIWDNRSMLHRAQGFDDRHRRVMHHVRVAGQEPVIAPD
jgi:alpha-ketoglutarate-dependent taurine dioxygenase